MPWQQEAMKDVVACEKPRGAGKLALIRGCPNGETRPAPELFFIKQQYKVKDTLINVVPAQAGIYNYLFFLDSRLRGNDKVVINQSFLKYILIYVTE